MCCTCYTMNKLYELCILLRIFHIRVGTRLDERKEANCNINSITSILKLQWVVKYSDRRSSALISDSKPYEICKGTKVCPAVYPKCERSSRYTLDLFC
jgi:hypothetical protein